MRLSDRSSVLILLILATGLCAAPALAENYLPLAVGNTWHYAAIGGHSEDQVVTATHVVWGTPTYVIDYQNSSSNAGLENYWTTDGAGDVLLWGWWRELEGFGLLWQPPIPAVEGPLFLG